MDEADLVGPDAADEYFEVDLVRAECCCELGAGEVCERVECEAVQCLEDLEGQIRIDEGDKACGEHDGVCGKVDFV